MRPRAMVVAEVAVQPTTEMSLVQDDRGRVVRGGWCRSRARRRGFARGSVVP
jgi:hypothetical protein